MVLQIKYRALDELVPYARNARKHSPAQIGMVKASLLEFGWTTPIAIADDGILAGHARTIAAKELRDAGKAIPGNPDPDMAPTADLSHLSPKQRRAYIIADNQLALKAGWDDELLRLELGDIREDGFDLGTLGFEDFDLTHLLGDDMPDPVTDEEGDEEEEATGSGGGGGEGGAGSLALRFGVPPFSVLNAREGWWQNRKRAWLALGIRSEVGRGENLLRFSDTMLEPDPEKRAQQQAARAAMPGGGSNSPKSVYLARRSDGAMTAGPKAVNAKAPEADA